MSKRRRLNEEEEEIAKDAAAATAAVDSDNDDDDSDDESPVFNYHAGEVGQSSVSRGLTRSGATFRQGNRAYYATRQEVVRAHPRLFSGGVAFTLLGRDYIFSSKFTI
jgi:elongation factor P hydroxylase